MRNISDVIEEYLKKIDGKILAMITREGDAVLWDAETHIERLRIVLPGHSLGSRVALAPDGALIAVTGGVEDIEHSITLLDTKTGAVRGELVGHKQRIWSIAFSPDGRTIASSSGGGALRFWNVEAARKLMTIREPGVNLTDLNFSPDGRYLVGASLPFAEESQLRVFEAPVPK
jgi:WD40 repeat protein